MIETKGRSAIQSWLGTLGGSLVLMAASHSFGQQTVTWTGGADDAFSNPNNWDPPISWYIDPPGSWNVIIPSGASVRIDIGAPLQISTADFTLGENASVIVDLGRTIHVGEDASLSGYIEVRGAGSQFVTDPARSIIAGSRARFRTSGGGVISVGGTDYSTTGLGSTTLVSSEGSGSVTRFSALTRLHHGTGGGRYTQTISTSSNGHVDLSKLETISITSGQDDLLDFVQSSGGTLNLSSLREIESGGNGSERVRFFANSGTITLGALERASRTEFRAAAGASITADALTELTNYSYFSGGTGSVISMASLTDVSTADFTGLASGSTLDAPLLTNIRRSTIDLDGSQTFITGQLSEIDDARIYISGGTVFDRVTDTSYLSTNHWSGSTDLLRAEGAGTELRLGTISEMSFGYSGGRYVYSVVARDGGLIDLSGLSSVSITSGQDDIARFTAESGGVLDLRSVTSVTSSHSNARVEFHANSGGQVLFGDLQVGNRTHISIADPESSFSVAGSLNLNSGSFSIAAAAEVVIGKHLMLRYTDETAFNATTGIIRFSGDSPLHYLELAGLDVENITPGNNGNFGIGQLIVGDVGAATTLTLLDVIDNGNQSGVKPEALYLFGLGGPTGLVINEGSVLNLNGLNVYFREDGEWIHLNGLFGSAGQISFGGGTVLIPTPAAPVVLLLTTAASIRRRR